MGRSSIVHNCLGDIFEGLTDVHKPLDQLVTSYKICVNDNIF